MTFPLWFQVAFASGVATSAVAFVTAGVWVWVGPWVAAQVRDEMARDEVKVRAMKERE